MPFLASLSVRRRVALSLVLAAGAAASALALGGPDAAALVADAARAVAGDRAVAALEDAAYGVRDRLDRMKDGNARPAARWVVPERHVADGAREERAASGAPTSPAWSPADVGPMYGDFAAEGDGAWVSVSSGDDEHPVMKKTLLHPDRARAFSELFVVAVDVSATTLHYVADLEEPENVAPGSEEYARRSDVPASDRDGLLAAFNGGFKTRHGHHGVEVSGVTLVPMRRGLCTLAGLADGSLALGALEKVAPLEQPTFVRQSARCLVEGGVRHPWLVQELTASWGAAVGGDTVIRRSAVGLSADRRTLFVGVSNRTTATALADGMLHAGASTAAQLDVNEAFPRFLTYKKDDHGTLVADSIAPGFHYRKGHYLNAPSSRDFFYLTRKAAPVARVTPGERGPA